MEDLRQTPGGEEQVLANNHVEKPEALGEWSGHALSLVPLRGLRADRRKQAAASPGGLALRR